MRGIYRVNVKMRGMPLDMSFQELPTKNPAGAGIMGNLPAESYSGYARARGKTTDGGQP
jgi:hypothetical protein